MRVEVTAPIFSKELPMICEGQQLNRLSVHHNPPDYLAKLWRYLPVERFVDMVDQGGFFFARSDLFTDVREGTISRQNCAIRRDIYDDNNPMRWAYEKLQATLSELRRWTYINCWRVDEDESADAWRRYVDLNGIAVQTSYLKLSRYIGCIYCAVVEYVDYDATWIPETNVLFPFIFKDRTEYGWEREFRLIIQQFPTSESADGQHVYHCEQPNSRCGLVLELPLNHLIDSIVVPKALPAEDQGRIYAAAARIGARDKISYSTLC